MWSNPDTPDTFSPDTENVRFGAPISHAPGSGRIFHKHLDDLHPVAGGGGLQVSAQDGHLNGRRGRIAASAAAGIHRPAAGGNDRTGILYWSSEALHTPYIRQTPHRQ